jgi:hypothetical protein
MKRFERKLNVYYWVKKSIWKGWKSLDWVLGVTQAPSKCKILTSNSNITPSSQKKHIYCMIPTVRHSGKGRSIATVKISALCRDWGRAQRIFRTVKLFYIISSEWKKALCKPMKCATPRVNPHVNYGLWTVRTCQCGLINCNKCACG